MLGWSIYGAQLDEHHEHIGLHPPLSDAAVCHPVENRVLERHRRAGGFDVQERALVHAGNLEPHHHTCSPDCEILKRNIEF